VTAADYFVSDVHLAPERPRVTDLFLRFLDRVAGDGARLFLLGDIFDLWVGPKQSRLPYVVPTLRRLRDLAHAGVEIHYVAGNRDFNFDARMNGGPPPQHLPEHLSIESAGKRLYLTHGDLLCTGDAAYRRARRIGRSAPLRFAFGFMPLPLATFLSRGYRRLSARVVAAKPRREVAVDFARVRALLERHDAVVCGHVHRGARYRVDVGGGRRGEFITLGDWTREPVYLVARGGELSLRRFA
jgi:UDP-2,3-diacylglucosamine hydrolase